MDLEVAVDANGFAMDVTYAGRWKSGDWRLLNASSEEAAVKRPLPRFRRESSGETGPCGDSADYAE
jgi:hypothetical protein